MNEGRRTVVCLNNTSNSSKHFALQVNVHLQRDTTNGLFCSGILFASTAYSFKTALLAWKAKRAIPAHKGPDTLS